MSYPKLKYGRFLPSCSRADTFYKEAAAGQKDQAGLTPGWTGWTWDPALFPYPADFISYVHSKGLRTTLNLHPGSGAQPHERPHSRLLGCREGGGLHDAVLSFVFGCRVPLARISRVAPDDIACTRAACLWRAASLASFSTHSHALIPPPLPPALLASLHFPARSALPGACARHGD